MSATTTPASRIWQAASARLIEIEGFIPTPRGIALLPPRPLAWPEKDPGDTLDYAFDVAPALAGSPGDAIATVSATVSPDNPGDVTIASTAIDGTRAVLWLAGGQPGTTYTVTVSITTLAGRNLARSIALPVVSLASVPAPASAITTPGGAPITSPFGQPITAN
ncbi:phage fiber-tail adaptor protein [Acidiphilium multivorum]|uniref:phage fiber-tail adaptor protein n=1 Tax=Acidiphilium multivorum TaxID=62140 RepID=UPI001B8B9283|nr:hypothetical protein [Acidiphilium multivorum]MBS3022997.1 hypothetical protein [Acidiphilium multivorum]